MMLGINSGMVMQRNSDNVCEISVYTENEIKSACYIKEDGASKQISLRKTDKGAYILSGIPTGGPYTVNIDGEIYKNVYVGDVWLLGGQSNMEGVGELTDEDLKMQPDENIRAFYMNDVWGSAKLPLMHDLWNANDKVHRKLMGPGAVPPSGPRVRCVGPGFFFGQQTYNYEQVPQGLICCAHGGTTMDQWSPAEKDKGGDESLYGAMYRRFVYNGSNVKGLFWYQGCSDASPVLSEQFESKMINFIKCVRNDFGKDLPVVQVQISRVAVVADDIADIAWSKIRELQRCLHEKIDRFDTVYAIPYELSDAIHLSSASQRIVGKNAAELMYKIVHGNDANNCKQGIRLDNIKIKVDEKQPTCTEIMVTFSNLHGKLKAEPTAMGFELLLGNKKLGSAIFNTKLQDNMAFIHVNIPIDDLLNNDVHLAYGYGINPSCNITDESGYSIPAFGPIKLNK